MMNGDIFDSNQCLDILEHGWKFGDLVLDHWMHFEAFVMKGHFGTFACFYH